MIGSEDMQRKAAALRAHRPFAGFTESERALVAAQAVWRRFMPGQIIVAADTVPDQLFICVEGDALIGSSFAPAIFDAPGLLFGRPARQDHRAGAEGLTALAIARPHAFTIARECPDFVVGLLKMDPREPA